MTEREIKYQEYDERIDRYLHKQMNAEERTAFKNEVNNNDELRKRLVAASLLAAGIADAGARHSQAQIDAIKHMSKEEFVNTAKPAASVAIKRGKSGKWWKWTTGIAAAAAIAIAVVPMLNQPVADSGPVIAEATKPKPVNTAPKPVKINLASLADKYNKLVPDESDEMAANGNKIRNGGTKEEMLALANSLAEAQRAENGPSLGAEDADAAKEELELYNDCVHWYKALAFLKANEKANAVAELKILKNQGKTEELIKRANGLLKELGK